MPSEALISPRIPNTNPNFPLPDDSNAAPSPTPPPFFVRPVFSGPAAAALGGPPQRGGHSELAFRISEDLHLDGSGFPTPAAAESSDEIGSEDDVVGTYMDVEKIGSQLDDVWSGSESAGPSDVDLVARPKHRHSSSVDVSSMASSRRKGVFGEVMEAKKAMPPEKLAELAMTDPNRAKRILANRQSAARSKQRKAHYMLELEQKVQRLQTESTTLSAQLTFFQRDITELATENARLKLWLQTVEQQVQLCDRANDALRQEIQRLKVVIGESSDNGDNNNLGHVETHYSSVFEFEPQFQQPQLIDSCSSDLMMQQTYHTELSGMEIGKKSNNMKTGNSLAANDSSCNSLEGSS